LERIIPGGTGRKAQKGKKGSRCSGAVPDFNTGKPVLGEKKPGTSHNMCRSKRGGGNPKSRKNRKRGGERKKQRKVESTRAKKRRRIDKAKTVGKKRYATP